MNFKKLTVKEVLSETQFYSVEKIEGDRVQLKNDEGKMIVVDKAYVEGCLTSALQVEKEETMSRTEVSAIFQTCAAVAVTVNFNKQVKEADVAKEIQEAYENSTPKEFATKMKKSIKKALEGEERTMTGRHYGKMNELGRIQFIDMKTGPRDESKDYDTRMRLVDPRTINWFICRGIKYIAK